MYLIRLVLLLALVAAPLRAQFEFKAPGRTLGPKKHTKARLVLSHETARPGDTVVAGVELTMDKDWHTYWFNGGESGLPTEIFWNLPAGITAGATQWPVPEKYVSEGESPLTTYVYHDRAVLLVPLQISPGTPSGEVDLAALVKWLECDIASLCVPGSNMVRGTLLITNQAKLNSDTNFFAEAGRHLPGKSVPGTVTARWDAPPGVTNRPFVIEWETTAADADFYPFTNEPVSVSVKTAVLSTNGGKVLLRKTAERTGGEWPREIAGLLVRKEAGGVAGYETVLKMQDAPASSPPPTAGESKSLFVWLIYAFIGGLILNIMPCVLPVIALKILGFVSQSREHPKRVRALGLFYTLGVIASFLVLAGLVIGVKAAGQKAGWGMQFSNPQFIVILTVIVTLVALNLFGVFEITLSGGAMSVAGSAASRHGGGGAFMNGVLATVLATPCTAPFLGASLGFAFAQPAHLIVLFFVVIALGLALPYLLLSWNPKWLKFLPKPGAWMERFKVGMGFPMLATAVWLFTLTDTHYGKRILWLGVFLVLVAAAAWVFGEFFQRGRSRRGAALVVVLLLLGGGYLWAVEAKLRWRQPLAEGEGSGALQQEPGGIPWQRWSPEAVAKFRAEGRPVLVDFTAEWCVTCNTIVKPALESATVRAKLKEVNAVALLADYTKFPPAISAELEKYGRAGVPMVLVFSKDASRPATVLPEAITPGMVVQALDAAVK